MMNKIIQFRGEYAFLSNFYELEQPLVYDGISFPTIEHFYQAMKWKYKDIRQAIASHPSKGLKAYCKTLPPIREDWDVIKLSVMEMGLRHKFSDRNPVLKQKLLATRDMYIEEGNYWNDRYWGVCLKSGIGDNRLGQMLMDIRLDIMINEGN